MKIEIDDFYVLTVTAESTSENLALRQWLAKAGISVSDLERDLIFHLNPNFIEFKDFTKGRQS